MAVDNVVKRYYRRAMTTTNSRGHAELKRRLKKLGWSQAQAAREVGCDPAIICRLLSGERGPSVRVAVAIEESELGIPVSVWTQEAES